MVAAPARLRARMAATGYLVREPLIWHETHPALDEVLLGQTGGHSRGTLVDVDGRPVGDGR